MVPAMQAERDGAPGPRHTYRLGSMHALGMNSSFGMINCPQSLPLPSFLQAQVHDDVRWSDSLPYDHTPGTLPRFDYLRGSPSSPPASERSVERENSPSGREKTTSQSDLQNSTSTPKRQLSTQTQNSLGTPNTHLQPSPAHDHTLSTPLHNGYHSDNLNNTPRVVSREVSMTDAEEQVPSEEDVPFCNCPPDPEIPPHIKLRHLTYVPPSNSDISRTFPRQTQASHVHSPIKLRHLTYIPLS